MWGISYFKLDSLKERKFAFQRIKFTFQRIKFAFQRFKFAFQRIKFAFQRIKFAFQRIKFAFQRIKFAFQRIKFASKESSCCKVVVSSVVHRNMCCLFSAKGLIYLPMGYGTLEMIFLTV